MPVKLEVHVFRLCLMMTSSVQWHERYVLLAGRDVRGLTFVNELELPLNIRLHKTVASKYSIKIKKHRWLYIQDL